LDGGTTAKRGPRYKAKTDEPLFIRIPALCVRSSSSSPSVPLIDELVSVANRFKELQARTDANEEEIRKRSEKLNMLLMEIEMQDLEEWRMEQQVRVLERCSDLMMEHRAAFIQRL
jgi:vacuolar-type H+-ATPase subunit I/STV1